MQNQLDPIQYYWGVNIVYKDTWVDLMNDQCPPSNFCFIFIFFAKLGFCFVTIWVFVSFISIEKQKEKLKNVNFIFYNVLVYFMNIVFLLIFLK